MSDRVKLVAASDSRLGLQRIRPPVHCFVLPFVISGGKSFRNPSRLSMIVVDTRKADARIGVSGETNQQTGEET